jgi:hypothetical protein
MDLLMTHVARIGILIAAVAATGSGGSVTPTTTGSRAIVVAELFTSEGCSSCPPADALLRRLVADQPIDGVEIVGLGNHVDYWDHLGWRDPFSSALFSQRQSAYASAFRLDSVYTPQIVVDGTLESVGSDDVSVQRNIVKAAKEPKAVVDVSAVPGPDPTVHVDVRVQVSVHVRRTGPADVLIAVTEDGLVSRVQRGENSGRTLSHAAVVRLIRPVAHVAARDQSASGALVVKLEKAWSPDRLRLVALLQEQTSHRIIGAGVTRLPARRPTP